MSARPDLFLDVFSPDYRRHFGLFIPRTRVVEPLKGEALQHYDWLTDVLYTASLLADAAVFVPHAFVLQCPVLSRVIERNRLLVRESLVRMPMGDRDVGTSLDKMRRTYLPREFPSLFTTAPESTIATVSEAAIAREAKLGSGIVEIVAVLPETRENGGWRWDPVPSREVTTIVRAIRRTLEEESPLTYESVLERAPSLSQAARDALFASIHYAFGIQHLREYGLAILADIPGIRHNFGLEAASSSYSYRRAWGLFGQLGLSTRLLRVAGPEGIVHLRFKPGFALIVRRYARAIRSRFPKKSRGRPKIALPRAVVAQIDRVRRKSLELVSSAGDGHHTSRIRALGLLDELANIWVNSLNRETEDSAPAALNLPDEAAVTKHVSTEPVYVTGPSPNARRVALLTVIGPELEAIKQALKVAESARVPGGGELFYETTLDTRHSGRIGLEIYCIAKPGNSASSAAATRAIWRGAKFVLLCGIAAGLRHSVKIGDVVVPRAVVDATLRVAQGGTVLNRPLIVPPVAGVLQMNACASVNRAQWHHSFAKILPARVVPEPGKEREYAEHVTDAPALQESVILSDNILLRDASVLIDAANDLHQQIRAGEMEAAGCVMACTDHYPPIPWFVIRGVSDFGDDLKNDRFHSLASAAVASYAALYLRDVLDLRIWEISS